MNSLEKFEIQKYVNNFKKRLDDLTVVLNLAKINQQIDGFEQLMTGDSFWNDALKATKVIQSNNELKEKKANYLALYQLYEELVTILAFDDEELFSEATHIIKVMEEKLEKFEVKLLLTGEYDHLNAIVDIHPGAGGTESQDWALMLYRMYKRFSERSEFLFELIDYLEASDAGIKGVTFIIKGPYAFGTLKSEKGVHRLVRISPFDSNARRHTSFAAVNITPEIDDDIEVDIAFEDIKVDTYRSSGAGGQHVNTTDSAVRLTHLPTGIVVSCQNERSQIQNKERAMRILKSKLYQFNMQIKNQKLKSITGTLEDNAFGSQIRSYVLHPYALVKDHRTDLEYSNPFQVLDGDLDIFINAYLRFTNTNR